jgi:dTDP-glucose 4,6-dehydratase
MEEKPQKKVLITGGAGFIGSHVVRLFVNRYTSYQIYNLDALTYAGNLENLRDIENRTNYRFIRADITDRNVIFELFDTYKFDSVIHLAAESHVDRSISDASDFLRTNINGTVNLLDACKNTWGASATGKRFYHISTDEVYGSIKEGTFDENSPYHPNSPYAASKASSDHFVRTYGNTYGLPVVISNCSNNYGPYQFPEKFIPLCINNLINSKPIPLYGKGENIRDWLHVEDHAEAIDLVFHHGKSGETYCIGGGNECSNMEVAKKLCLEADKLLGNAVGSSMSNIKLVADRPGHDFRYAINFTKIEKELGWKPLISFDQGLTGTFKWYLEHSEWLEHVTSGAYQQYYELMYGNQEGHKKTQL